MQPQAYGCCHGTSSNTELTKSWSRRGEYGVVIIQRYLFSQSKVVLAAFVAFQRNHLHIETSLVSATARVEDDKTNSEHDLGANHASDDTVETPPTRSNSSGDVPDDDCEPYAADDIEDGEDSDHPDLSTRTVAATNNGVRPRAITWSDSVREVHQAMPWSSWSQTRTTQTACCCVSSCIILAVRLVLNFRPLAYLIHSIIVFFDMILIHLFTHSLWLSVAGKITTIIFFMSFWATEETLYELMETTFIAILCSFHLILSRGKHIEREAELEGGIEDVRQQTLDLLQNEQTFETEFSHRDKRASLMQLHRQTSVLLHNIEDIEGLDVLGPEEPEEEIRKTVKPKKNCSLKDHFSRECNEQRAKKVKVCGAQFFEYFLDGSAGVMYTSFIGLILTEVVKNIQDSDDKCK